MLTYRLNEKDPGTDHDDVLHKDPAGEGCNLDDTSKDRPLTERQAFEVYRDGHSTLCQRCFGPG